MAGMPGGEDLRSWNGPVPRTVAAALVLVITCGLALAAIKPSTRGLETQSVEVTATRINDFRKPAQSNIHFGRLEWRGGLQISSPHPNFGGWSGLAISQDGNEFLSISDAGAWMSGRLTYDGGRLAGIADVSIGALKAKSGKTLIRPRDRDAEALTLVSGTLEKGEVLIGFESNNRIGRFPVGRDGIGTPTEYLPIADDLRRSTRIDGIEALAIVSRGNSGNAIVAFEEHPEKGEDVSEGWIWIAGEPHPISVRTSDDFAVTDAVGLPDGGLVLLERRYRPLEGVRMRLREIPAREIQPGRMLDGEVLIEADPTTEIDNMEGLAVHREADGTIVLTIISDDNFNRLLQRTLIVQFALLPRDGS